MNTPIRTSQHTLPRVGECIQYVESCGWKRIGRLGTAYFFENPNAPLCFKQLTFTLTELRHAFKHGF